MSPAADALRQIVEGWDFSSPKGLLRSISAETATEVPAGAPYSIATNVAHAQIWQGAWLCRLRGEKLPKIVMGQDFPIVTAEQWPEVRKGFIDGMQEAYDIACREPFTHGAKSDQKAIDTLFKIANHGAYHLGQVSLLKRMVKIAKASS